MYGLSSIVGRFLNWCLVPLYVYIFPTEEYGVVSYLYSFTAVALVVLNYGMETGFFRFAGKAGSDAEAGQVYGTSLVSVGVTSAVFIVLMSMFSGPLSVALRLEGCEAYVWMLGVVVGIDAFCNIPFAFLRFRRRAMRFAAIKLGNVALNIGLNLFFILCCPRLYAVAPGLIGWFYEPLGGEAFGIGWIFVANLISSLVVLLMLLPELGCSGLRWDGGVLRRMLRYSWPLLVLGVAGIMSQNMGQMVIPFLVDSTEAARSMVGVYGANIKIAIVMVMFTQAFRYAYEPFIFSRVKGEDKSGAYCDAMKFFVVFGLAIFLGVMFFLPVLKYFVSEPYWGGLRIVPIMMMAELFFGVFFNLSLWYKLTDRTVWGMYFSVAGFVLMFVLNVWLVPVWGVPDGYIGSAWAAFVSYFVMMVASYVIGRRYYPLAYPLKRLGGYVVLAGVLYAAGCAVGGVDQAWVMYGVRVLLLGVYVGVVARFELRRG